MPNALPSLPKLLAELRTLEAAHLDDAAPDYADQAAQRRALIERFVGPSPAAVTAVLNELPPSLLHCSGEELDFVVRRLAENIGLSGFFGTGRGQDER